MGNRNHVAVELRVEHPDGAEAVCDRVSDGTGDGKAGRAIQQDGPAAGEFAGSVHLGETGDSIADNLVVLRRGAEADLEYVVGAGDVESAHGVLLCEITAHDGRGICPDG